VLAEDSFKEYSAYVDIEEDDQPVSVFRTPGQNWRHCKKELDPDTNKMACVDGIGWLGRDARITVVGPSKKAKTKDILTDQIVDEDYTEIEFSYDRRGANGKVIHQTGRGYIESSYLTKKKTKSFYTSQNSEPAKPCPPDRTDPQSKIKKDTSAFKDISDSSTNLSLEKKAALLSETVVFCPRKPPTKTPSGFDKNKNVYDQFVLPTLLQTSVPKIVNESGKQMTREELIQIDTLARTLYGEIGSCYRRGLQYPMAVAKVILNRTNNSDRHDEFIFPPHSSKAPTLTKVCTSPSQFSMWLKKLNSKSNGPLHQGLCPPREANKPFWKSDSASKTEADIWKNTMRIATEAILYPKKFKERTSQVDGYFYTSDVGSFFKMRKVIPSIEGKPIDNSKCLEMWKE